MSAPTSATPSWGRIVGASVAAGCLFYPLGLATALVWFHPFVSFIAFLILTLATMRLHVSNGRVAGVAVDAARFVRGAA